MALQVVERTLQTLSARRCQSMRPWAKIRQTCDRQAEKVNDACRLSLTGLIDQPFAKKADTGRQGLGRQGANQIVWPGEPAIGIADKLRCDLDQQSVAHAPFKGKVMRRHGRNVNDGAGLDLIALIPADEDAASLSEDDDLRQIMEMVEPVHGGRIRAQANAFGPNRQALGKRQRFAERTCGGVSHG